MRDFISPAALLVNVIAKIELGTIPSESRYATRRVITRVFPDPAPAMISSGPSTWVTAARCSCVKSARISSALSIGRVRSANLGSHSEPYRDSSSEDKKITGRDRAFVAASADASLQSTSQPKRPIPPDREGGLCKL